MSEDLATIIEELIKSEKGDIARLQNILDAIKSGEPVSFEDHQYVENLVPNPSTQDSDIVDTKPDNTVSTEPMSQVSTPQDTESKPARSPSRKYATVGIIVAVVLVAYIGLELYAVNSLQFRPHHGQQVIISDTQLGIQSEACNPSYFPATFTKYKIIAMYKSEEIENATIDGVTLSPKSAAILNGVFSINKETAARVANESLPFDPAKASITTSVYAPIFGIIPYTVDTKYSAQDFQERIKHPPPGTFDCYP
jgi:hypothetical protein